MEVFRRRGQKVLPGSELIEQLLIHAGRDDRTRGFKLDGRHEKHERMKVVDQRQADHGMNEMGRVLVLALGSNQRRLDSHCMVTCRTIDYQVNKLHDYRGRNGQCPSTVMLTTTVTTRTAPTQATKPRRGRDNRLPN